MKIKSWRIFEAAGDIKPGKSCHMSTVFKNMKRYPMGEFSSVAPRTGLDPSVDSMRPIWSQCKERSESQRYPTTEMLLSQELSCFSVKCSHRAWRMAGVLSRGVHSRLKASAATNSPNVRLHRDFPSGPVVKTPCSLCRGPGFNPWSGS